MDLTDFVNGLLLLVVGGFVGAIGTYLIKPRLDAWLKEREEKQAQKKKAKKEEEEALKRRKLVDDHASQYRAILECELRDLSILDMVRPLDLERTYVRLRIQDEQPLRYADEEMSALAKGDPNLLIQLGLEKLGDEEQDSLQPEEALRKYRHMAVLGDPGAGKTTMLKYLCLLSAQAKLSGLPDFPVFLTLNRYAKNLETDFVDFVAEYLGREYRFPQSPSYLEERLAEGSVILFLDGLDEVTVGSLEDAEAAYHHTAGEINRLAARYPKCPIVVTSRRAGWKGSLIPAFRTMAVLDFSWEDIQRFVNNWFGQGSDQARGLLEKLAQQPRMQALAANPLLLSLISIAFEKDLELPERRARLYERCVQVLLTEWDAHRGIKRASHFTTDRKRDLLEDLALHFHRQGLRYFPKDELLDVIVSYLPTIDIPAEQAPLVLDEISAQHGLLKEQAADWYGFLHLTLQEYFAAVSLGNLADSKRLDLVLAHIHNPWWEEVILLLAGRLKDATPLLEGILSGQDDIFASNLLLAGRCLSGTPRIKHPDLRKQIGERLEKLVVDRHEHWLPKGHAVRILDQARGKEITQFLLDLISDPQVHWQIQVEAVEALAARGDGSIVQDMLAILPNEQIVASVRERIVDVLATLRDGSTPARFRDLLADETISPQVRGRIARTLGRIGDVAAVPQLVALLSEQTDDYYVPWYAARALVDMKVISDPNELLKELKDEGKNIHARWALAKTVMDLDKDAFPKIVEALFDNSLETSVRWNMARRLGYLGGEAVVEDLHKLFADELLDLSTRGCIGTALLGLGDGTVVNALKELLSNRAVNYYVRIKIAQSLVRSGERDIAPRLLSATQEEDLVTWVRLSVTDLLGSVGDPTIAPQILELLKDEQVDSHIRARAADALSALEIGEMVIEVRALVLDEQMDSFVRGRAVHCFTQDERGIGWLVEILDREDLREEAYKALFRACRRFGVRVFRTEDGYEISPIEST